MVIELVGSARRRFYCNQMLAQGAWALSAAMGAVIILLLLGTQILDWQWLLLLPLATLAVGIWRTVRRVPSAYSIAQMIDRRLGLVDTLSTAYFFDAQSAHARVSDPVREWQRTQAERVAAGVRVGDAVPFSMPRAVYALAILAVAASSLFALRYGLERRLNLEKPLARILQQAFGLEQQQLAALDRKQPPTRKRTPDAPGMEGLSLNEGQLPDQTGMKNETAADASSADRSPESRKGASKSGKEQSGDEQSGDEAESGDEQNGQNAAGDDKGQGGNPDKNGEQQAGKEGSQGSDGNNSSLMAKFREAMKNLMSRMKQPPSASGSGQQQSGKNSQQGKQQAGKGQNGKQGQQQSGGQQSEGQEGQEGAESQTAESAAGRGSGQSGEENASKQPGSGVGKQDGNKDVKLAEQLAAMGKISEIIGKRSANVSGEVTVEVQKSYQQLSTPYANRSSAHGETAAEISRDEVPEALQAYVQQYFEQVRKQAPAAQAPRD